MVVTCVHVSVKPEHVEDCDEIRGLIETRL